MQRMSFENSKHESVTFEFSDPWVFWKVAGTELPAVALINTTAPGQHGYTLDEILYEPRTIKLSCHVHGKNGIDKMYLYRRQLNAVCNPLLGLGTLHYENDIGRWKIAAFCRSNTYATKIKEIQTLDLTFECPSPFWERPVVQPVSLAYIGGGLKFPVVTPNYFGISGYLATIDNQSDVPVYPTFELTGGGINPVIKNLTTGEFIAINKDIAESDRLFIDTNPETLEVSRIYIDPETNKEAKENAYGYLTFDSNPFQLVPGENRLTFTSDNETQKVKVIIKYTERFVGV